MLKKIALISSCLLLNACSFLQPTKTENPAAAEINIKLALAYLEQNEIVRSKTKLLMAQKQAPSNPVVWYTSGYFFEHTGNPVMANEAYLKAIQLAPHLGTTQNNYGAFLCRQGRYSLAITHFLLAIQDPNYLHSQKAYENAAQCALKIPDKLLAEKYFRLSRTGIKTKEKY